MPFFLVLLGYLCYLEFFLKFFNEGVNDVFLLITIGCLLHLESGMDQVSCLCHFQNVILRLRF